MPKTGNFYWSVRDGGDVAGVNQTFNGARSHTISLNSILRPSRAGQQFIGKIETITIKVKAIAGGATKLTIKGVLFGTAILPDTEADIALDVGSTTEGSVAYYAGAVTVAPNDTLEIFYTCDAGTLTVDQILVSWSE